MERLVIVFLVLLFASTSACIHKYGTGPRSPLESSHGGSSWDYRLQGDDWDGVDREGREWQCMTGDRQSPINLPTEHLMDGRGKRVPQGLETQWTYPALVSDGSNIEVINNGHTIQVEWLTPFDADVRIAVPGTITGETTITDVLDMESAADAGFVKAEPTQFHFHATSEHLLNGTYFPLEMHIVHKVTDLPACADGCFSVTGILFELADGEDNPLLASIWDAIPMRAGDVNYLEDGGQIELSKLLPPAGSRDYVTYEGSLTTPPCTQGLLWHVMMQPQTISPSQWRKFRTAIGEVDCPTARGDHHHRRLLAEEPVGIFKQEVCQAVAYGSNFRSAQSINDRIIRLAKGAPSLRRDGSAPGNLAVS